MRNAILTLMILGVLATAGCASKRVAEQPADTSGEAVDSGAATDGSQAGGIDSGALGENETPGPQGELLGKRVIYFEFDRADLKAEDTAVIAAHARYLSGNSNARVRLEGHSDERGTREYNIGLGERRSQTVRRAMMLQGVADAQITTVSYGEERPAAAGSDEMAWQQNRRVEIVYLK